MSILNEYGQNKDCYIDFMVYERKVNAPWWQLETSKMAAVRSPKQCKTALGSRLIVHGSSSMTVTNLIKGSYMTIKTCKQLEMRLWYRDMRSP